MEAEKIIEVLEAVDTLSEEINQKESDCLNKIFLRFCLLYGLAIDYNDVRRKSFAGRTNYWEYWYKYGTDKQFFLMSRELTMDNGIPQLHIVFSNTLTKNNEL